MSRKALLFRITPMVVQAASPDEEALVQGAAMLGFKLISRSIDQVISLATHHLVMHMMTGCL